VPVQSVADRLRLLQAKIEGESYGASARMAKRLGIKQPRWHNFLAGKRLSLDVALQIVQRIPGVSLDWLYRGRPEGLTYDFAERLGLFREGGPHRREHR
jgi:hypothetical protein